MGRCGEEGESSGAARLNLALFQKGQAWSKLERRQSQGHSSFPFVWSVFSSRLSVPIEGHSHEAGEVQGEIDVVQGFVIKFTFNLHFENIEPFT